MKVATVIGARPQFIKAAPVCGELRKAGHREVLIHTGQHYDPGLSQIFFEEMGIAKPDYNLNIGSAKHGRQTGLMLAGIEEILEEQQPQCVLIYGDTNSTLAGALAAAKLHIPIGHIESGLRSFNRLMPEEINRVVADHCANFLFCPTQTAVENLAMEGITRDVFLVGDTMYDAACRFQDAAKLRIILLADLGVKPGQYLLATVHRPYNTDDDGSLRDILLALADCGEPVVFPIHPRTRKIIDSSDMLKGISLPDRIRIIEPVGYLDMLMLEQNARLILTDSGGIQKEAYFLGVPCITLRPETEWVETVEAGWNVVVGSSRKRIMEAVGNIRPPQARKPLFGDGTAGRKIVRYVESAVDLRSRGV